ncbi:MAG: hypothetical protein AABX51_04515 [Nanoarchaeota archaeon]
MSNLGQGTFEVILVSGAIFIVMLILFNVLQEGGTRTSAIIDLSSASNALQELDSAGQAVYEQGKGAQVTLSVSFPNDVKNVTFNNMISTIYYKSGKYQTRSLSYNSTGSLPTPGLGPIKLRIKNTGNEVCFGNLSACP